MVSYGPCAWIRCQRSYGRTLLVMINDPTIFFFFFLTLYGINDIELVLQIFFIFFLTLLQLNSNTALVFEMDWVWTKILQVKFDPHCIWVVWVRSDWPTSVWVEFIWPVLKTKWTWVRLQILSYAKQVDPFWPYPIHLSSLRRGEKPFRRELTRNRAQGRWMKVRYPIIQLSMCFYRKA